MFSQVMEITSFVNTLWYEAHVHTKDKTLS